MNVQSVVQAASVRVFKEIPVYYEAEMSDKIPFYWQMVNSFLQYVKQLWGNGYNSFISKT